MLKLYTLVSVLVVTQQEAFASVRLVGGRVSWEGRAEYYDADAGAWGSICDKAFVEYGWPSVLCRDLGFAGIESASYAQGALIGTGAIAYHGPACDPNHANNMTECGQDIDPECDHSQDVFVKCIAPVRLFGGRVSWEGRAEYYDADAGAWGSICDEAFGVEGWPTVVCTDLGYSGVVTAYHAQGVFVGTGPIAYQGPACNPQTASDMTECGQDSNPVCGHSHDVFIQCKAPVRLFGGEKSWEGRAEYYDVDTGAWGSICDKGFVVGDWPNLVCRNLGYAGALIASYAQGAFVGTGAIAYQGPRCNLNNANDITECGQDINPECDHSHDVFVKCIAPVRLFGGEKSWEGRAEYYDVNTGAWGSICDRRLSVNDWPSVFCRDLGFAGAESASYAQGVLVGTGVIAYHSPKCNINNANDMTECRKDRNPVCGHSRDVFVQCTAPVRLFGGRVSLEGRAEYYDADAGAWGSICDAALGVDDWPSVFCTDLGFAGAESASYAQGVLIGTGSMAYQGPRCNLNNANDMTECGQAINPECGHSHDVFLQCRAPVRLYGGRVSWEGRAEYYDVNAREWGSICDRMLSVSDWPSVFCRDLGFVGAESASYAQGVHVGNGAITYKSPKCNFNNANDMTECGQDINPECDHSQDVFVQCTAPVRLFGGEKSWEGRAEYYDTDAGAWGSICDAAVDVDDWPSVLCTDLGFAGAESASYAQGALVGTGAVAYQGPRCNLNDTNDMTECGQDDNPVCDHSHDVFVQCRAPVRLVGGRVSWEGRAEYYDVNAREWGSICDRMLSVNDWPSVFCRDLGFVGAESASYAQGVLVGNGAIASKSPKCNLNDANDMTECGQDINPECDHSQDVFVQCTAPVRLVGESVSWEGRAEYYDADAGAWGSICDSAVTVFDWPSVLCRDLGFAGIQSTSYAQGALVGNGAIASKSPSCNLNTANDMTECGQDINPECDHSQDVFVQCTGPVRLVGGEKSWRGRTEYYDVNTGAWGSICDATLDVNDWPSVFCTDLGFAGAESASYATGALVGTGVVAYHSPSCNLNQTNDMTECGQDINPECDHSHDVFLQCTAPVRLVGGAVSWEGRAEYYDADAGAWGSICDAAFGVEGWPTIVCTDLGYSGVVTAYHAQGALIGTGHIAYVSPACGPHTANEMTECGQDANPGCDHSQDVFVRCTET